MHSINPLLEWAHRRVLPADRVEPLSVELGLLPDTAAWRHWLDRVLLVAGALLLAASLVFFVAANWSGLGKVARFALAQGALLAGVAVYAWRGDDLAGRSALAFCVLAVGALFALYGQTYQTGADPWQLFALWALVAAPLVWLARAGPLTLFWLLVVDLGLLRWLSLNVDRWMHLDDTAWPCWALALVHGGALAAALLVWPGTPRYLKQVLYLATLVPLAFAAFFGIIGITDEEVLCLLPWLGFGALSAWLLRGRRFELLPLSALALSAVVLITTQFAVWIDEYGNPLVWLLLAGIAIGLTTVAGTWLLRQVRAQRAGMPA